jgi:phosphonopyruvate decarboxylase
MLAPSDFYHMLQSTGVNYYAGVPDSLLKSFCAYVSDHSSPGEEVITANEGAAVALAAGHHLATGRYAVVYMQNSGLGNAINPLLSLADAEVYSIPMLLLVGWRGEPGKADEPQHIKQGKVTRELLDCLGIANEVLPGDKQSARALVKRSTDYLKANNAPFAIVVPAGIFESYEKRREPDHFALSRESALQAVMANLDPTDIVVATTGMTSRELFEYRAATNAQHSGDFLTVGSMGHASSIAMAIASSRPARQVICLDGDGAAIMHMGSMAVIGTQAPKNFKHIVINNGAHDSVGGQPTAGYLIDLPGIATACRYRTAVRVEREDDLPEAVAQLRVAEGPAFLEILTRKGARNNLGRPTISPIDNKKRFMRNLAT